MSRRFSPQPAACIGTEHLHKIISYMQPRIFITKTAPKVVIKWPQLVVAQPFKSL